MKVARASSAARRKVASKAAVRRRVIQPRVSSSAKRVQIVKAATSRVRAKVRA